MPEFKGTTWGDLLEWADVTVRAAFRKCNASKEAIRGAVMSCRKKEGVSNAVGQ